MGCEAMLAINESSSGSLNQDRRSGNPCFLDRRARLMRWGWPEAEAETLADRLVRRDHDIDDRVSCIDCLHYRPSRCGNHGRAGLNVADIGRDVAALLQRCPGFDPIRGRHYAQEP